MSFVYNNDITYKGDLVNLNEINIYIFIKYIIVQFDITIVSIKVRLSSFLFNERKVYLLLNDQ